MDKADGGNEIRVGMDGLSAPIEEQPYIRITSLPIWTFP